MAGVIFIAVFIAFIIFACRLSDKRYEEIQRRRYDDYNL